MGEALARSGVTIVTAWVCAGLLAFVALGRRVVARVSTETADEPRGWLGTTEAVVVLVSVVVVFGGFVAVQARYLFGGDGSIASYGFTYSDYARRGFFELAFVAVLVGALVMTLEHGVRRRTRLFVASGVALCVLTGAVLASAALRMSLYQQAFGWTELRFYVGAAIVWLALGVVLTIGALVMDRSRWLLHGLGVAALVVTLAVNVIGPSQFIASQNLARALDKTLVAPRGTAVDEHYLFNLSDDSIPVILAALHDLDAADREGLDGMLRARLRWLEADARNRAWQGWNLSRERARAALQAQRDQLRYLRDSGTDAP